MKAYERKIEIMKVLNNNGKAGINDLALKFGVTKVTIRGDLDSLEKRGLLVRTHGGAVSAENHHLVRLISKTIHEKEKEKKEIAKLASQLINPGSTIMIDSGSTTAFLARYIKNIRLTVITNSVLVLRELSGSDTIELFISGGALRRPSMAMIGEFSRFFLGQVHTDIMFLGATSFSIQKGISCTNLIEAETKRNMMKSGLKVCLLADSSKLGKVSLAHICDWEDIDILVTDFTDPEDRESLEGMGVEVLTPINQGGN